MPQTPGRQIPKPISSTETLKGTLVHECGTSDDPLCALRCVQEYHNPIVF